MTAPADAPRACWMCGTPEGPLRSLVSVPGEPRPLGDTETVLFCDDCFDRTFPRARISSGRSRWRLMHRLIYRYVAADLLGTIIGLALLGGELAIGIALVSAASGGAMDATVLFSAAFLAGAVSVGLALLAIIASRIPRELWAR